MPQQFEIITLKIDGKDVGAKGGETILQVARENGIWIPTLCHLNGLSPVGACRLCLVEVKGFSRPVPSCVTKVSEGMEVTTQSERLQDYRKAIVELLLSERNHVCSVCMANGRCELQDLAQRLGVTHLRFERLSHAFSVDASHSRFVRDDNRCILCGRCVRVCAEIEGAHTWDFMNRGHETRLVSDLNQPWSECESCTGCGKCVQVCPTGALLEKAKMGTAWKKKEFLPYLALMRQEERHE